MHRIVSRAFAAFFSTLVCFLTFASTSQPADAQTAGPLDVNARIQVTVAGEADISGIYTVDSSGDISLLYVNQIHILGLTVQQAQQAITQKLLTIYRNPQVAVEIVNAGGIEVSVSGAVTSPGTHTMRSDSHLNDVIQISVPTLDADLSDIEVTHGRPGETHSVDEVDYGSFLDSRVDAGNPQLKDGDVIFVRRKTGMPIQVVVRGEVQHPGRLTMPNRSTVEDAVEQAGDLTPDADRAGIVIQHSGSLTQIPVDYAAALHDPQDTSSNPLLLDGDIVIVRAVDKPNTYTITGGVVHPGEYDLPNYPVSLADVLGKAGGSADHAKLDKTTIVRTDATGKVVKLALNAKDPASQKTMIIRPGDNIYIPMGAPRPRIDPLEVIGAAASVIAVTR